MWNQKKIRDKFTDELIICDKVRPASDSEFVRGK